MTKYHIIGMNGDFKIKQYKPISEISWLKGMVYYMVDKYYFILEDDLVVVNSPACDENGTKIGIVENIIIRDNIRYGLIKLENKINFDYLIQSGINIEHIIFN